MLSIHAFVLAAALAGNYDSGNNDLVLLDFGADWCVPCRSMEPTLQRLEEAGYPVRRVNVEQSPELASRFAVGSIPCFVLVRDGREVQRTVGATSYDRLVQLFQQAGHGRSQPSEVNVRGQSPDQPTLPTPQPARHPQAPNSDSRLPAGRTVNESHGSSLSPFPASQTNSPPPVQATQLHQLALRATVRIRVSDETGLSKGTGTIIDVHGDEALVLTCGHIFRDSQGKGEIQVDLFVPGTRGPVPGQLLTYECEQRDFALISIRPDVSVSPAQVAAATYHPQPGEPIFSIGCDRGADPTVRVSTISRIDRYMGPPNIEIHGHPVEGRSGGGLFTADGKVVGICNAADLQEDRGIFAALPTIHLALDQIGQSEIYLAPRSTSPAMLSNNTSPTRVSSDTVSPTRVSPDTVIPAANTVAPAAAAMIRPASRPLRTNAAMGSEVVCIVRSPDGTSHVLIVKNPSAALLRQMAVESQQRPLPAGQPTSQPGGQTIARLSELPSSTAPVIRAQGY